MPDELTRLPDRQDFTRDLKVKIGESCRGGFTLALLVVKLLHLHEINTTFGYRSGDELLIETASRIKSMLRKEDALYRVVGNTFALILPTLKNENVARLAANKLLTLFEEPFEANGHKIKVYIKIGMALSPDHTEDPERLAQYADTALDYAVHGTQAWQIYEPSQSEKESRSIAIEQDIHAALDNSEFVLFYQPQLDLQSPGICGMEALIRWQSPIHGFVPPDLFIPQAEKGSLIVPLTLWTFNTAMRQCKWFHSHQVDVAVSVNLSASVLKLPDLVGHVTSAMNIWGIPPGKLMLEVTESAVMEDPEQSLGVLKSLHDNGVLLSIDDFGTGYSSMSYLSRFPVSELKVDKSFVMQMTRNENDHKIVRSIIDLAHNFGLTVVAEGIEDEATLASLIGLNCDRGQGYLFGRPMPAEDFMKWTADPSWRNRFRDQRRKP